jgi:hypothetical protein
MDLKFLTVLVLITLITLYFINEFKLVKIMINENNENTNKLIKNKFHTFSGEIKELNTDLVNQTKKINRIHSQKITNMSNYFTDSENDQNQNVLNYLSESKDFKIDFNTDKKNNDDDIISNTSNLTLQNLLDVKNELSKTSDKHNDINDDVRLEDKRDNTDKSIKSKSAKSANSANSANSIKSKSAKSANSANSAKSANSANSAKSANSANSIKSKSECDDNISVSETEQSLLDENIIEHKSEHESRTSNNDDEQFETVKIESAKITKLEEDNTDTISIQSKAKSLYDKISFGSTKSKGLKPKLQIGTSLQENIYSDRLEDNFVLEDIKKYTVDDLKDIANKLNINNYYLDKYKKRKIYKKEELYLKIKDEINSKNK